MIHISSEQLVAILVGVLLYPGLMILAALCMAATGELERAE